MLTQKSCIFEKKTHTMIFEGPYDIIHTSYQYLQLVHDYDYLSVLHLNKFFNVNLKICHRIFYLMTCNMTLKCNLWSVVWDAYAVLHLVVMGRCDCDCD